MQPCIDLFVESGESFIDADVLGVVVAGGQGLNQTPTVTPSPTIMSTTLSPGTPGTPGATPGTSCCSTGRPILTDPLTGQTVCSCQLTPSLMSYPRLASLPESLYGSAAYTAQALMASPFAAAAANGAAEPAAYFSPFAAVSDQYHVHHFSFETHPLSEARGLGAKASWFAAASDQPCQRDTFPNLPARTD